MLPGAWGALCALLLALALWATYVRVRPSVPVPRRALFITFLAGSVMGVIALGVEREIFRRTGLRLDGGALRLHASFLSGLFVVAPLEEAFKLTVVWPSYRRQRLNSPVLGFVFALASAAGFSASASVVLSLYFSPEPWQLLAWSMTQLSVAAAWGLALGWGRWFPSVWLLSIVARAVAGALIFSPGGRMMAVIPPVMALFALEAWLILRAKSLRRGLRVSAIDELLSQGPSFQVFRDMLAQRHQRVNWPWIVLGSLTTLGVLLTAFLGAVYVGYHIGIDFSSISASGAGAVGPLILLVIAVACALPLSGYLVARASGAGTVLEPSLAVVLALVAVSATLSLVQPVSLVLFVMLIPVGFLLASFGAWFGLSR